MWSNILLIDVRLFPWLSSIFILKKNRHSESGSNILRRWKVSIGFVIFLFSHFLCIVEKIIKQFGKKEWNHSWGLLRGKSEVLWTANRLHEIGFSFFITNKIFFPHSSTPDFLVNKQNLTKRFIVLVFSFFLPHSSNNHRDEDELFPFENSIFLRQIYIQFYFTRRSLSSEFPLQEKKEISWEISNYFESNKELPR